MMDSKRHLPDVEQWSQSSGSNVIPTRARPSLAGLMPHILEVRDLEPSLAAFGNPPPLFLLFLGGLVPRCLSVSLDLRDTSTPSVSAARRQCGALPYNRRS